MAAEHLKSLLEESATDPVTRTTLFQSKGFCLRHAWQGVDQRQALPIGIIYGSLLEKGLKDLSPKKRFWNVQRPKPCLICESEMKRDQNSVEEFAQCFMESQDLREGFLTKGILCLPHLERVLAQEFSPDLRNPS